MRKVLGGLGGGISVEIEEYSDGDGDADARWGNESMISGRRWGKFDRWWGKFRSM